MNNKFSTIYTSEVYNNLVSEYHGTWPPNQKINLGDIGTMVNGVFKPLNQNITANHFLNFNVEYDDQTYELNAISSSVSVNSTNGGVTTGIGGAQTDLKFNQNFGAWVKIPKYKRCYITNLGIVGKALVAQLYDKDPQFWSDKVIVTELFVAESGNIVISVQRGTEVTLDADFKLKNILNVADISINANATNNPNIVNEFPLSEGSTPFFKFGEFRKGWLLNGAQFIPMSDDDNLPEGAVEGIVFNNDVPLDDFIQIEED